MIEAVCSNCKKKFLIFPSKLKVSKELFCSTVCYHLYRKKIIPDIECDNCKKKFHISSSHLKMYGKHFCSLKCQKFYRKIQTPDVNCEQCSKKIHRIPFYIKNNKRFFCSYKCKSEFQKYDPFLSEKMKGEKNPMWKGDNASEDAGRVRARTLYPEKTPCIKCGIGNSHRHHKDGNPLNNKPSNILRLCHACHMKCDVHKENFEHFRKKDGTFGKWKVKKIKIVTEK